MASSRKAIAVLISDIHFTPGTLDLASASLKLAQRKALELSVPLIIAGDTLDTKAVIRAECANALIGLLQSGPQRTFMLVGNHDLINEKGQAHALNFLKPYVNVVESPTYLEDLHCVLIPYMSDKDALQALLARLGNPGSLDQCPNLIMHQGVMGAHMGHYVQDKTSLPPEAFDGFRVISGHYHRAQDIKCGETGLFSYIGNPYSLSFGEAHDGLKGFRVLHDDGSLESIPTNLRRHVIKDYTYETYAEKGFPYDEWKSGDLLWIKIRGTREQLSWLKEKSEGNYKWDLIPTESTPTQIDTNVLTEDEILDTLIDATTESEEKKTDLKALWREVLSET